MSCTGQADAIAALVDGTIDLTKRRVVEAHLAECPACSALADDLLVLKRAARSLPPVAPPEAARARVATAVRSGRLAMSRRWLAPLAAAALLVIGTLAGLAWWRSSSPVPAPAPEGVRAGADEPPGAELGSVETELRLAEQHFQKAIAQLETLTRDQQVLEPEVAAELQKNLLVIDRAIGESRAALQVQPTSAPAQESLFEAFRSKIALLQDTIALINEMRKGDQAGAARIAEGLNKS